MFCKRVTDSVVRLSVVVGLLLCWGNKITAQTIDTIYASYNRKYMHYGDLVRHLEQENIYTIYQGVYQGQWADGDPLIFSVQGSSYRNSKYYIRGMRVDDRYNAGSSLYRPDIENNNLLINYRNSRLYFETDSSARDYIQISGNFGGLDEVDSSTEGIVHWFHGTGTEGAYDKDLIQSRQHTKAAGKVDAMFTLEEKDGKRLRQHLYATYGARMLPNIGDEGLVRNKPLYKAKYYALQADGQITGGQVFDERGYMLHIGKNGSYGSAHYYNRDEVSNLATISGTYYVRSKILTAGLTYTVNRQKPHNQEFERNIVDQDGEGLYPWSADAATHEVTWYADYRKPLSDLLKLHFENYNSYIGYKAKTEKWGNRVYAKYMQSETREELYDIEWQSKSFGAGLLENSFGVEMYKTLCSKLDFRATADLTIDGFLLKEKSHVVPHWQVSASADYHPKGWLKVGVNVAYDRIPYNIEHIRYFSNDYLNGKAYFEGTKQIAYTTGGAYHKIENSRLLQPSVFALNIPIVIMRNGHELTNYVVMKKFIHPWMTKYAGGAAANGREEDGIFYQNPGESKYDVGYQPLGLMGEGFKGVPYFIGHTIRYTYTGEKVRVGLSWQSMMGAGPSALGVGPYANDFGVLDESTANPNTHIVIMNKEGKYPAVGRVDQDKAYTGRIFVGYNVCDWFAVNGSFKWTDGQPFSPYQIYTSEVETAEGRHQQQGYVQVRSRGINPTDGNFGCRESAIFNFDISVYFNWKIGDREARASVYYYNSWDYGNVLNEYMFPQGMEGVGIGDRGANMCLTVPGGIVTTFKIDLR